MKQDDLVYTSQDIFIAAVRATIMKYNLSDENPSMTSKTGDVVVTKDHKGNILSVTRQDQDGKILSVIAESGITIDTIMSLVDNYAFPCSTQTGIPTPREMELRREALRESIISALEFKKSETTLLDEFAMRIMPSLIAIGGIGGDLYAIERAYQIASSMMDVRKKFVSTVKG